MIFLAITLKCNFNKIFEGEFFVNVLINISPNIFLSYALAWKISPELPGSFWLLLALMDQPIHANVNQKQSFGNTSTIKNTFEKTFEGKLFITPK